MPDGSTLSDVNILEFFDLTAKSMNDKCQRCRRGTQKNQFLVYGRNQKICGATGCSTEIALFPPTAKNVMTTTSSPTTVTVVNMLCYNSFHLSLALFSLHESPYNV